jgi:hypothetical protein
MSACGARAHQIHPTLTNVVAAHFARDPDNIVQWEVGNIIKPSAYAAPDVVVPGRVTVEPCRLGAKAQGPQQTHPPKNVQVAIYRAQTDVRKPAPDDPEHLVCSRMPVDPANFLEDHLALPRHSKSVLIHCYP